MPKSARSQKLAIDSIDSQTSPRLVVTSDSFPAGQRLPDEFSGYGQGRSPALHWSGMPTDAKSTVVLVEDPDSPAAPFTHWVLYNLPPTVQKLPEAVTGGSRLTDLGGALQGNSSAGRLGYFGPRPPQHDPPHHYHFEVFALDRTLDLPPGASRDQVVEAMQGHVLASGEVVGLYQAAAGD
jgi:Raf kinase inhibitor-like YbhB/YbcL family protein